MEQPSSGSVALNSKLLPEDGQPVNEEVENLVAQSSTRTFVTNEAITELNASYKESPIETESFSDQNTQANTKSDFFVYCSTCDDLNEGKLRVRCAKCLSGAFTVASHPQGWSDVLVPGQVIHIR